jgi:hypothetical protein
MEQDLTVFIHVVGRNDMRVGERYTYPGLGRWPTSRWLMGRAFCDVYRVRVEEWAPGPELYDLVLGLYDASTGERLQARDAEGAVVGSPVVGQVRVAPQRSPAEIEGGRLDYRLGDHIALLGYDLSGPVRSGVPLTVTLTWYAEGRPAGDYTVFVHLVNETGEQLAQHDGRPRYGRYPTSAWQPGDVVPDQHVLEVPVLADGETMLLAVGMYQLDTMTRLPVVGPEGPVLDDRIVLPLEGP